MIIGALCIVSLIGAVFSILFLRSKATQPKTEISFNTESTKKKKVKEQKSKQKQAQSKLQPPQQPKKEKEKKKPPPKKEKEVVEKKPSFKEQVESLSLNDIEDHSDSEEWLTVETKKSKSKNEKNSEKKDTTTSEKLKVERKGQQKPSTKSVEKVVHQALLEPIKSIPIKSQPSVNKQSSSILHSTEVDIHQRKIIENVKELEAAKRDASNWEKKFNDLLKLKSDSKGAGNAKEISELREKTRRLQNMHDTLQSKLSARESECQMLKSQLDESIKNQKSNQFEASCNDPVLIETLQSEIRRLAKELVIVNQRNELLQTNIQKIQLSYESMPINGGPSMNGFPGGSAGGKNEVSKKQNSIAPQFPQQNDIGKLNKVIEAKDAELKVLEEKIKNLKTVKKSTSVVAEVKKNDQDDTKKLIKALDEKYNELKLLKEKINILETAKKSTEQTANHDSEESKRQLEETKKIAAEFENKCSTLQKELATKNEAMKKIEESKRQLEESKKVAADFENKCLTLQKELATKNEAMKKIEINYKTEMENLKSKFESQLKSAPASENENLTVHHNGQIKEFVNRIKMLENTNKAKDSDLICLQEQLKKSQIEKDILASKINQKSVSGDSNNKEMNDKIKKLEVELDAKVKNINSTTDMEQNLKKQLMESENNRETLNTRIQELEAEIRNKFDNNSLFEDGASICSQAISEEDFVCLQNQLNDEKLSKKKLQQHLVKLRSLVNIGQDALREEQAKASNLRQEIIDLKRQLNLN